MNIAGLRNSSDCIIPPSEPKNMAPSLENWEHCSLMLRTSRFSMSFCRLHTKLYVHMVGFVFFHGYMNTGMRTRVTQPVLFENTNIDRCSCWKRVLVHTTLLYCYVPMICLYICWCFSLSDLASSNQQVDIHQLLQDEDVYYNGCHSDDVWSYPQSLQSLVSLICRC